jgi:hypothetical protein
MSIPEGMALVIVVLLSKVVDLTVLRRSGALG